MPVARAPDTNVVGGELLECSAEPLTGFFRDGCCATGPEDVGSHTVCAIVTEEFLAFSRRAGNDLWDGADPMLQTQLPPVNSMRAPSNGCA